MNKADEIILKNCIQKFGKKTCSQHIAELKDFVRQIHGKKYDKEIKKVEKYIKSKDSNRSKKKRKKLQNKI